MISRPQDLEVKLASYKPKWVFFLDWSWIIPEKIIKKYKCVCFHEADLPNFRGGSPIQNQIVRGVKKTKLTAFLMDEGLDTGDILLQEDLSLEGHISEIFTRVTHLTSHMISRILNGDYTIKKQKGEGSYFKRRKPEDSEIKDFGTIGWEELYDKIRMLEYPYPNAFINLGDKQIVFKTVNWELEGGIFDRKLVATVEIV